MALQIMVENPRDINEVYSIAKVLGKGSYGVVKQTKVKATGAVRAVKSIEKDRIGKDNLSMLKTEMKITKMVDHPNIVKLYEIFEDALNLHLVLELCLGGHLSNYIKNSPPLDEFEVAMTMKQIIRGVLYLHNSSICHRDLKPENILILDDMTDLEHKGDSLKITDFGVSCVFEANQVLKARVGTPDYMAPEVIKKSYDQQCDIWSCGVIMYKLFSGVLPFTGADREDKFKSICTGKFGFGAGFVDASQGAMDFVTQMLTLDTQKRVTALHALKHTWFSTVLPSMGKRTSLDVMKSAVTAGLFTSLWKFKKQNRFIKAASCLVASLLSRDQVQFGNDAFQVLDTDGDGIVTANDIKAKISNMLNQKQQVSRQESSSLKHILREVEKGLENYTYTEFLAATFDRKYLKKDVVKAVFSAFDQDGNNVITLAELASGSILGHLKTSELMKLVDDCDLNGDGEIDFDEFQHMMSNSNQSMPKRNSSLW